MDIIREQIGLAMTLYHFNIDKLAKNIFIKWLQGGIDQVNNIGVNSDKNKDQLINNDKHQY